MPVPNRKPIGGEPTWFHGHGSKMLLDKKATDLPHGLVVIKASAAIVEIFPGERYKGERRWIVRWAIIHSPDNRVLGQTTWNDACLAAAFGLHEKSNWPGEEYTLKQFGGDSAAQGCFICWYDPYTWRSPLLNIPGPGSGHDGDPNVSIVVDVEMQQAVKELLSRIAFVGTERTNSEATKFISGGN